MTKVSMIGTMTCLEGEADEMEAILVDMAEAARQEPGVEIYSESKEHIAGFYIVNAEDLDAALLWAGRVSACVGRPIEVQPFAGTGRVADQFSG